MNNLIELPMDASVEQVFSSWETEARECGIWLRSLIYQSAQVSEGVGEVVETLKWGQPAYLTQKPKSGSTIRIGQIGKHNDGARMALFFHCQTTLVEIFRQQYSDKLNFEKNRAIVVDPTRRPDEDVLRHCITLAHRYHLK